MAPDLPAALRAAIDRRLEGTPRKGLAERAALTSEAYRAGKGSASVIRDAEDALAYALTRLPATYAACAAVFTQAALRAPGFAPARLLDAGAGPGAASWAASQAWPDLASVTWLDASGPFLALATELATQGPPAVRNAEALRADLTAETSWPTADLVVASYALAELPSQKQAGAVAALWHACEGMLVLVEPGTPAGYARILAARETLIVARAAILAPCPHQDACPLTSPDWCHFAVRLPRSRDHRLAKGAAAPFEDEKFAYLIAVRPAVAAEPPAARVLAPPRAGKPGIELKLCTPAGLERRFVARRDKPTHAAARRVGWGDAL